MRNARCTKKRALFRGEQGSVDESYRTGAWMLADCCSSREAVISRTSFCFDWPRAYSLLLTPTAFDEPVFRLPVVCVAYVACAATATSNHPFKLLIPVLRVLRLLHDFRCCAYGHFVDCHCHCRCFCCFRCFRCFCYDCWQPAVLRNAEGNRVDGLLNRRAMERSIGASTRIQSAEARANRGSVRPFVRTAVSAPARLRVVFSSRSGC